MRTGVSLKRIATRNVCVVLFVRAPVLTLDNASHHLALGQVLIGLSSQTVLQASLLTVCAYNPALTLLTTICPLDR